MFRAVAYAIKEAFQQIGANKGRFVVCLLTITAMLLILGFVFIIIVNVGMVTEEAKTQFDTIQIYMLETPDESLSPEEGAKAMEGLTEDIISTLSAIPEVKEVEFVSKDQAMTEFKVKWGDNAYLLEGLPENPLPNSIRVKVHQLEDADMIAEMAADFEGVEDIKYYQSTVQQILHITDFIKKGALIVVAVLIVISIVVVVGTVRLAVEASKREIRIMKFIGATNWFVRGPFLVQGILIGFFAAILSCVVMGVIYQQLTGLLAQTAFLMFAINLVPVPFLIQNFLIIFAALGISVGAVGSIISMRRFLKA